MKEKKRGGILYNLRASNFSIRRTLCSSETLTTDFETLKLLNSRLSEEENLSGRRYPGWVEGLQNLQERQVEEKRERRIERKVQVGKLLSFAAGATGPSFN